MEIEIIRGDLFEMTVSVAPGFQADIAANPMAYQARLALRYRHDDALSDLLSLSAPIRIVDDEALFSHEVCRFTFSASPDQTQALPHMPLSALCEVRSGDGGFVRRLFDATVSVRD